MQGYTETDGGFEADVHGLAVPLFGPDGTCIGALAVAAPSGHVTAELKSPIVQETIAAGTAATISWGGVLPPKIAAIWRRSP